MTLSMEVTFLDQLTLSSNSSLPLRLPTSSIMWDTRKGDFQLCHNGVAPFLLRHSPYT